MPTTFATAAICVFFATGLVAAAVSDVRDRRIPNQVILALAVGAPVYHVAAGSAGAALASILPAFLVLAAGLIQYRFGWLGAGDVKLAAAVSLWLDPAGTAAFVVWTALIGALLAVAMWTCRPCPTLRSAVSAPAPSRRLEVPYGVAIAAGGLLIFAAARPGHP